MSAPETITVRTRVDAPVDRVWAAWTDPDAIRQWNAASDDWHCPAARVDLRPGGDYVFRMAARDGSAAFDLKGTFTEVDPPRSLASALEDGRAVRVTFEPAEGGTAVTETFEAESMHPAEMQRAGWQSILDRFKAHVEAAAAA